MSPLAWIVVVLGTLLGFLLGYLFARFWLLAYTFSTSSYNCATRTINMTVTGGSDLHRLHAIAVNGIPALTTLPPAGALVQDHNGTNSATLHSPTWPNSGTVTYVVWGCTFTTTSGTVTCAGSGSAIRPIKDLEFAPPLKITIPDGPLMGAYIARPTGPMKWEADIRKHSYTIVCESADSLIVHGQSTSAPALSIATGPFSATFPGKMFQAAGDVLVTKE